MKICVADKARHKYNFYCLTRICLSHFRYLRDKNYDAYYYNKCQNLRQDMRQAYDEAFKKHDVLIMPTIPKTASKFPSKNASLSGEY